MRALTSWLVRVAALGNAGPVANADRVCRHQRETEAAVEARLQVIATHSPADTRTARRSA